ncbi:MFS transporter [Nonomuraea rubra]|uniref:MFS transporter n=1 Tax=Nonomuraea rubra TaxID=46180 RepID=UPI0033D0F431
MTRVHAAAATYREVFAVREFRGLFAAHLLSLAGDQLSKIAASAVVFGATGSALLAAITFGVGYLPWVVVGPVLATLSDRFPRRTVMVACDLARMLLMLVLAVPGLPAGVLIGVLFGSALLAPPAQAARSAIMPQVLDGDRYVVAAGISGLTAQLAQVLGFAAGGLLVGALSPRAALVADAATFGLSALLLALCLTRRPAPPRGPASSVLRDTLDGVRLVRSSRTLRACVLPAVAGAAFTSAPSGQMIAYAGELGGGEELAGLLLSAVSLGCVAGAVGHGRFTSPARRLRQVRAMAVTSCLALVPIAAGPPLPVLLALLALSGYGTAFQITLNARFVTEVPDTHRARAFGVAVAAMMAGNGLATAASGAVSDLLGSPSLAIGLCGVAGVVCLLPLTRNPLTPPDAGSPPSAGTPSAAGRTSP